MRFTHVILICMALMAGGCRKSKAPTQLPTPGKSAEPEATQPETQPARLLPFPAGNNAIGTEHLALAQADIAAGLAYLLRVQNADGGWGQPSSMPAITALILKALVQHPQMHLDAPPVRRGLDFLLQHVQSDGGIYDPQVGQQNYTTSVAVMALASAIERGGPNTSRLRPAMQGAVQYLKSLQIVAGSTTPRGVAIDPSHPFFGGTSYGEHGRPDLSNLHFTMEALHEAGLPPEDPFYANAVVFLARVQNRSESNDQPWAAVVNDDGFIYATAESGEELAGESKADEVMVDGQRGLRSYGSMTYAGFKSLLYANVDRDDPRVQAAFEWIRRYWRLDSNPNMPSSRSRQGLYYYYHVLAKALRAWGEVEVVDARGVRHNWRNELVEVLHEQQRPDGSWVNSESRWYENMPELVTAYSVLALEESLKPVAATLP